MKDAPDGDRYVPGFILRNMGGVMWAWVEIFDEQFMFILDKR